MAISFKGAQYPKSVILFAVFFYVSYAVSYRDLEEIMAERGVTVDHATLNRWLVRYAPKIADKVVPSQLLSQLGINLLIGHSYPASSAKIWNGVR